METTASEVPPFRSAADVAAFASVPLSERLDGRDLIALFMEAAAHAPKAPAIEYLPSGTCDGETSHFSRGELADGAAAIAAQLRHLGIGRGDVVASLLPNGPGTAAAALATMSMATLAPINIYLDPSQISALLSECGARLILVPRDPPVAIAATLDDIRHRFAANALLLGIDCATLPEPVASVPALQGCNVSDRVALFHTGGTTGLPKFVPLTALNLAAGAIASRFAYGYCDGDRVVCGMPMFHVGGLFACTLYPLLSGAVVTMLGPLGYRGDGVVAALWRTIAQRRASVVVGPPTVMAQFAADPPDRCSLTALRLFINGAAALPRILGERLSQATGVRVVEPWGLTEATLAVTSGPRDGTVRPGSVGFPLPYCEVKAVRTDVAGTEQGDCGADEIGVLAIRGPMVFDGYLKRAPQQQPFFTGGWLDSGDLGRIDRDGFVWVTGRAKELIKRGGHGIDPGVIEDALIAHEAVALAAAVGKPDAYAGEVPVAYVQLRPGAEADSDALIAFARTRIPERAAVPKDVIVLAKLPVTAVGKVHKQALKLDLTRRVAEAAARAIVGRDASLLVDVFPDPLHGLTVHVRVPSPHVASVRAALAVFTFQSRIESLDERS